MKTTSKQKPAKGQNGQQGAKTTREPGSSKNHQAGNKSSQGGSKSSPREKSGETGDIRSPR
jgi:hypothetical protein